MRGIGGFAERFFYRVILTRARHCPDDPFATFGEWDSEADREFGLRPRARTDLTRYPHSTADLERITLDASVVGGKPRVRGLHVTVGTILGLLAAGRSVEEILADYPYLEREDVQAASDALRLPERGSSG